MADIGLHVKAVYPWQQDILDQLRLQKANDRLPHALLFSGSAYLGKLDFSRQWAELLLCQQGTACGDCKTCHLVNAGSHPDFKIIEPESSQIKIEQVRELIHWSQQTAQMGGMKVAIVSPAEQMNASSANALLKCLEEPAADTVFILVTSRPSSLLPTVRSRCQQFPFPTPETEIGLQWLSNRLPEERHLKTWLRLAAGCPLLVLEMANADYMAQRNAVLACWTGLLGAEMSPLEAAQGLDKADLEQVILVSHGLFMDGVRMASGAEQAFLTNEDQVPLVKQLVGRFSLNGLLDRVARLQRDLQLARSTANPNKSLLLEALLIDLLDPQVNPAAEYSL